MCGLSGVMSSWLSAGEEQTFRDLAVFSTVRGATGSGLVSVPTKRKKPPKFCRYEGTLAELAYSADWDTLTEQRSSVLMGHARYPTIGDNSLKNVHPHVFHNLVGMHNGTMDMIDNVWLPVKSEVSDSWLLFNEISKKGVEAVIPRARGAYALTWVNTSDNTLNFLRNDKRPLYFAHYEDTPDTVYWSSEAGMLELALMRRHPEFKIKIIPLPVDTHIRFDLRPNQGAAIRPAASRVLKEASSYGTVIPFRGTQDNRDTDGPTFEPLSAAAAEAQEASRFKCVEEKDVKFKTVNGGAGLNYGELVDAIREGCSSCEFVKTVGDYYRGLLHWHKNDEYVCDFCYRNDVGAQAQVAVANRITH